MSLIPSRLTDREQEDYRLLREHHAAIREHESTRTRVKSLAESLAEAEDEHAVAGSERRGAKEALSAIIR